MTIVYFDSSAYLKLLVEEDGSELAAALWDGCDTAVASRLGYPEGGGVADDPRLRTGAVKQVEYPDQRRVGELQHNGPAGVGAELDRTRIPPEPS